MSEQKQKTEVGKELVCEACGEEFVGSRTHEECVVEQDIIFGEPQPGDRHVVCHDCWVKIMRQMGHHPTE